MDSDFTKTRIGHAMDTEGDNTTKSRWRFTKIVGIMMLCLIVCVVSVGGPRSAALWVLGVYYENFWIDNGRYPELGPEPQSEEANSRVELELREIDLELTISGSAVNWSLPFVHEDLSSHEVEAFAQDAKRIVSSDGDPFLWSEQLRALSPHGKPNGLPMNSDVRRILRHATEGKPLRCYYFAHLLSATCVAHGYTSRVLGLSASGRTSDHAVIEVYIPRLEKWVLIDCDFNVAYRNKEGIWLNAFEIQEVWRKSKQHSPFDARVRQRLPDLLGVEAVALGESGATIRESNMNHVKTGLNLHLYEWVLFDCRNNFLSGHYPRGHPIGVRQLFLGPDDSPPAVSLEAICASKSSLYPDVGVVSISLTLSGDRLAAHLGTITPNFTRFETRTNDEWRAISSNTVGLEIVPQSVQFRSVNSAGLAGPSRTLRLKRVEEVRN